MTVPGMAAETVYPLSGMLASNVNASTQVNVVVQMFGCS